MIATFILLVILSYFFWNSGIRESLCSSEDGKEALKKKVLSSNPVIHLKDSGGNIVFTLKPGEPGYSYYLMCLSKGKSKASYSLESPARSEADQLEIDRLREQKGVLEALLIENGITLPTDAPAPYTPYSWQDKNWESQVDFDAT